MQSACPAAGRGRGAEPGVRGCEEKRAPFSSGERPRARRLRRCLSPAFLRGGLGPRRSPGLALPRAGPFPPSHLFVAGPAAPTGPSQPAVGRAQAWQSPPRGRRRGTAWERAAAASRVMSVCQPEVGRAGTGRHGWKAAVLTLHPEMASYEPAPAFPSLSTEILTAPANT